MATFHQVKIKDIYKEIEDCSVITFDIPSELSEEFAFRQGQHLTLKADIDGEDVRRSYSLCSSPLENEWKVAVKLIHGGKFSTFINNELKTGDVLEIMAPSGAFGVDTSEIQKTYVAFVAGSGITPVISMIKTHLAKEPKAKFKLFYLNRTVKSIIFKEEIEQLRNKYFGRLEIFYFLTKEHRDIELLNGRFTSEKLQIIFNKLLDVSQVDEAFLCGPEEMIFLIRDELVTAGMLEEHVHYELFVSGLSEEDIKRTERLAQQNVEGVEVTIVDGGKEFHFTMTSDYDNILDAALAAGADLPFACKGGVCSTCKCQLLDGDVEMKVNYALEADEMARNFILSCQAVPTSQSVKVDFDV
ncbi:MAG: 2Fe-2S iron-sulfur cluster binding domain-containing protein [Flavobacteriaceae bacterium]|nr:2Fe-2S iron-sulfur cluster binding domain-containing protein [Flavobacteriaceae bacterium]